MSCEPKPIVFYNDDTWHVDVAKLSKVIDSILEKASPDTSEAALAMTVLFCGHMEQWGTEP